MPTESGLNILRLDLSYTDKSLSFVGAVQRLQNLLI